MEIEAKFPICDERLWKKYRECAGIGAYRLGVVKESLVVDEYFDTLDGAIRRAGYNLRVRTCDGKKHVTIKSVQSTHSRFSVREETEFPLHGDPLDVANWLNPEADELIKPLLYAKALCHIVQLRQHRAERPLLQYGQALATMSLDDVQVWYAGSQLDEFLVLEIELVPGEEVTILDQIVAVLVSDGLVPQPVAKLKRAMAAVEQELAGGDHVA